MAVRAPDFRPELEWINTGGRSLRLADFRGRVLLLDFWTYGCINCLHLIPELHEVERRFPDSVAVVGVHAGKYANERVTESIARACERLGVRHPVLNDRQFRTWREYAVNAWPTLVIVSATGYVVGVHRGEIQAERLAPMLQDAVDAARAAGTLQRAAGPPWPSVGLEPQPGPLRYPAALEAAPDGRLYVSDTGHHRVLEIVQAPGLASGRVVRVLGGGEAGREDGAPRDARFREPRGLALGGETLYVADTGNHLVRAVDLASGRVRTVAGTGEQARRRVAGGRAREVAMNSPWDLLAHDGSLYAAMAGWHQIWRIDPSAGSVEAWAGSGAEQLHDSALAEAALAQPSGLATDGERIFFADAEASAIRWARAGEGTGTVVGTGLFDFGDRDGVGDEARLQHPMGVAWWADRGVLLVADTYNHRLRLVDPRTREARAFVGSGEAGLEDGDARAARFREPSGIALSADGMHALVADTNNHRVRVVELASGRVATLELHG